MEKFKEALKHSDIVKVVLTGIGETIFSSEEVSKYIEELERLARIGKAFEDAKNKEFGIFEYVPYAGGKAKVYPITEYEYNKVIKWAESEGE